MESENMEKNYFLSKDINYTITELSLSLMVRNLEINLKKYIRECNLQIYKIALEKNQKYLHFIKLVLFL